MRSAAVARSSPTLTPPRATCLVAGRIYQKWSHHANLRADISFAARSRLSFALPRHTHKTREKRFLIFFDFFFGFVSCIVAPHLLHKERLKMRKPFVKGTSKKKFHLRKN
jgi:hypothetical protein